MNVWVAFYRLLRQASVIHVSVVLVLMVLVSLTEGIGLMLMVPILGWLANRQYLSVHATDGGFWWGWVHDLAPEILLMGFVALVAFRSVAQYGLEQRGKRLEHSVVDHLRERCFSALLHAQWQWLATTRSSDHADLLLRDVNRLGVGLHFGLNLLARIITLLVYLVAALALSWQLSLVALFSGALIIFVLAGGSQQVLELGQSLGRASRALQGTVQESLAGIKLAKILGAERLQLDRFLANTTQLRAQQLRFSSGTSLKRMAFQSAGATALAVYVYLGLAWKTPTPVLLTLVLVFSRVIPLLMSAHNQLRHWLHALPALESTEDLLRACRAAAEPSVDAASGADLPREVQHAIELRDVSFSHAEHGQPAVSELNLSLRARTTTAIVGDSGAGKSTLADLLMGLLEPQAGEIRVDGVRICGGLRTQWRRQVAYVPQECFLFHESIRYNLLLGASEASEAEICVALKKASAEFVFQLPQGLDTLVGDAGLRLSRGERQRIALARALLKRPSLLILDEVTSALDAHNESHIRRTIELLHGHLTVVIIGHRLPTLEHADHVIVLHAGTVKAQGRWDQVRRYMEPVEPEPTHSAAA